jgi:hypothetical protein
MSNVRCWLKTDLSGRTNYFCFALSSGRLARGSRTPTYRLFRKFRKDFSIRILTETKLLPTGFPH